MKNLRSLLLLLFIPVFGLAQSLNGVYTGVLSNDSTTIRKDQSFEMALTEYNGKVYGYAYSTFIVNDTLYYIVKRVKGKVEGDICEVEDDEVITHNFPQKPEKKVFVTYTLRRNVSDNSWKLDGNWKTNVVNKRRYGYYSISGKVNTKEEKDLSKSKLYEHLGDLDLQKTLAFSKPKETTPEKGPVKAKDKNDVAKNTVKKDVEKTDESITKADIKAPDNKTTSSSVNNQPNQTEKKGIIASGTNTTDKKPDAVVAKTDTRLPDTKTTSTPITNPPIQNEKKNELVTSNPVDKKPEATIVKPETKLPDNKPVVAAANNQPDQTEKKDVIATNTNTVTKTETTLPDNKPVPVNNQPAQNVKKDVVATNINNTTAVKPETKQPDNKLISAPVAYQPAQTTKKDVAVTTTINDKKQETKIPDTKTISTNAPVNQNEKKDVAASQKKPGADFEFQEISRTRTNRTLKPAAALVDGRETKPSETIFFKSDSLSIALYDNGEVDGDSVSVIINDVMFIEKQGLKSSAFRKTFYVPMDESDSLLVVLYADNLGKYPPNTGLLQIKDGEEIFYVRFKADLDRNAAIVLRRKSK